MDREFEDYLEMAKTYLAKKERKNYYESKGFNEPFLDLFSTYVELSHALLSRRETLQEDYARGHALLL